ncbi:TBC1 domain family member 12-like isoform X2 [Pungitius pungitius]|uniref:TBC1 domain family member 12-like isoform X2 n=1 Tax=Pungitius pungitius TaxID=134920 RepID=UPI002E149A71
MERSEIASSQRHHHHHRCCCPSSSTADVIAHGQQVTGSGHGECLDLTTCSLCRPMRCCSDSQRAGSGPREGVSQKKSMNQSVEVKRQSASSSTNGSEANCCGGGASDKSTCWAPPTESCQYVNHVTNSSDSNSDTQEGQVTSDLQVVGSDDAFTSEPPAPCGQRVAPPRCRNTFQCVRRPQSAATGSELQSRRPRLAESFSSRKQPSLSQNVPGWKLFGKVPPKQSPTKQALVIQQEFEARQLASCSPSTHHAAGQQSKKKVDFEPLSTTALILEDRPPNLPAKSAEETQRHRQQYEDMVAEARRMELKEAQRRQQQKEERFRQEEEISNTSLVWNQHILPHWDAMRSSRRARDLWWGGLPPSVRGWVWSLAVGNELNITAELYQIFLSRAKEKWRGVLGTDDAPELIRRDISRTLPSLCVFHKGGPYHNLLQSILGAYTCYRPDVGYVQGMSSIAAMLILNMDEVQVFISFSNLINRRCQLAFYRVDHQQMLRYFGAFQVFFRELLPRLFLHFQSSGVTPDLYLMDWILTLYVKPLPLDVASRVWDVFLRDGEEFLFRAALGILRLHQDVLLQMDLVGIAQFLSRPPAEEPLSYRLFSCIQATPLLSGNRKWTQVSRMTGMRKNQIKIIKPCCVFLSQVLLSCRDSEDIS